MTEHEVAFLTVLKRAKSVTVRHLLSLGMSRDLMQKLIDSGILVPTTAGDSISLKEYTVSDDVFRQ